MIRSCVQIPLGDAGIVGVADADRLLDHGERSGRQRRHRDVEIVAGAGGDDHDRRRPIGHHAPGRLEPVDPRQPDVHRDDVGLDGRQRGDPLLPARHRRGDGETRIAVDDVGQQSAHDGRILHDHITRIGGAVLVTAPSNQATDGGQQTPLVELLLGHVGVRAEIEPALDVVGAVAGRHDDHWNVGEGRIVAQGREKPETVHAWHLERR